MVGVAAVQIARIAWEDGMRFSTFVLLALITISIVFHPGGVEKFSGLLALGMLLAILKWMPKEEYD